MLRNIIIVGLFAASIPAVAQEKVPLEIDLPRPLFMGTPVPIDVPNLEEPRPGPRPLINVPAGTVNLALDKEVTSSDDWPIIGDLYMITDGDKEGADGSFVELGPGQQWVQIDLETEADIYAIVVWHYHAQARVYHDVIVQVSNDEEFNQGVRTVFNTDHNNSCGFGRGTDKAYVETNEGKLIETGGVRGRYVRLYSNGNTSDELNHYIEVEVYGIPVDA